MKNKKIALMAVAVLAAAGVWFSLERGGENANNNAGEIKDGVYKNEKYGFEIEAPEGARASALPEEGGESFLIKNDQFEMQIFVSPFNEDAGITIERIKQDIPDINMEQEGNGQIDGTPAATFVDADQGTRELWFARGGFLYQVSSLEKDDAEVGQVMQSWRWR